MQKFIFILKYILFEKRKKMQKRSNAFFRSVAGELLKISVLILPSSLLIYVYIFQFADYFLPIYILKLIKFLEKYGNSLSK